MLNQESPGFSRGEEVNTVLCPTIEEGKEYVRYRGLKLSACGFVTPRSYSGNEGSRSSEVIELCTWDIFAKNADQARATVYRNVVKSRLFRSWIRASSPRCDCFTYSVLG